MRSRASPCTRPPDHLPDLPSQTNGALAASVIGPNDLVIAATALTHNAILVTNNCREFMHVKGLQIEAWGEIDF